MVTSFHKKVVNEYFRKATYAYNETVLSSPLTADKTVTTQFLSLPQYFATSENTLQVNRLLTNCQTDFYKE